MIRTLYKKIHSILLFFLGLILIGILLAFNWSNYKQNLRELKNDVRQTIREEGWDSFLESRGDAVDLDETQYCIFLVDNQNNVTIYSNHYPDRTEEQLLELGKKLASHWRGPEEYFGVTYIYRIMQQKRYILLISGAEAMEASFPVVMGSILAGIIGLFMLWLAARKLSRWMVQPIEEMIDSEKTFMSNASHELKTPLTVIRANTELLCGEIGGENRHLQYIQQETDRMIAMVAKMLTLVRLDAPYQEQVQEQFCADEVLLDVIYPMESVAYDKQIQIETDIMPKMQMTGDPEQMKSVMSILLDNAISYTNEGGKIRIISGIHGTKFHLSVANTGEPIPQEQRERLFERFFRTDEARGDAEQHFGLGLSIAGRIVENQHGRIWVESKNGENIFCVTLPKTHKTY